MKKLLIVLLCMLLLSGCTSTPEPNPESGSASWHEKKTVTYESRITKEECALCNQQGTPMLSAYSGQKNLGIICINTCDIFLVEINRYDDHGNLIEEPSETFSIIRNGCRDKGMTTQVTSNPERGFANVNVSLTKDVAIDKEAVENLLCSDCLFAIIGEYWNEPYGVGVIDFDTLEVRLLEEKITGFTFGDYYIDIDHKEKEKSSDPTELDLLIIYCPPRYN